MLRMVSSSVRAFIGTVIPGSVLIGVGWFVLQLMPAPRSHHDLKKEHPELFTKTKQEYLLSEEYKWRKEVSGMVDQMRSRQSNTQEFMDNYLERKQSAEKQKREVFKRLIKEGKTSEEEVIAEFKRLGNPDTMDIGNQEYLSERNQANK